VYNKDTDKTDIAEIIIGKHRSGPTGIVEVRFFKEFTRFENLSKAPEPGGGGTDY
jgi:replicative DNA helicase